MGEVKTKYKRTRIDTKNKQIVDIVTGELTEFKNESLYTTKPTNQATIDYKNYVYLDTDKLSVLLSKGIKQVELGLLITLSSKIQNRYCVCLKNEDQPHTTKSIAHLIGESPQSVKSKLNKLIEIGVLVYTQSIGNQSWGKVYIMNPHFIKKGINFSKSVCELFNDLTLPELMVTAKDAFSSS